MQQAGKLFLCATPIGNLDDMTLRLMKTLEQVAVVAAEDTRHTRKLLSHINVAKKLISYNEHNKEKVGSQIIELLKAGNDVALVSDAGYPAIADPGEQLVALAIEEKIKIVPVPGANAALSALVASGLPTATFFFVGFLPKTKKNRQAKLELWKNITSSIVLYEAPHRIKDVLKELNKAWGNRQVCLARELTKLYEEFFRGSVQECLQWLEEKPPRGEFTIVIAGADEQTIELTEKEKIPALARLKMLIEQGQDKKSSLKQVAVEYNMAKRELYKQLLDSEEQSID